ncbi:AAA family ATPase [cf. Phormidesmis sp. LEGE 11477]|uniref:AAA family ATPase n=1 Tax=cf. Phormidesmis sp. LEGE 11477 TaxID=1828680 RepID=UPI00187F94BB|nr:SMC family ATPase [cf. Phormidesmis sp. LEGE 11477]MBE9059735.1 SMC family ATPase [cf. Phormidesmis sp. LEGE 11477]
MVPKRLRLQNFLSYQEVVLDFSGLHVACVCGPNGAGKSSLLEAIAWCIWGQSRVSAEDDIIRQGSLEAQVSFYFEQGGQSYRIIRTRRRQQNSSLEFQIETATGFRSLTQKGVRTTQQYISQQLKIDYETFVNAAYLRQGRADEFMLKRPAERKQVLADLLGLDHYDRLAEQAKAQAKDYKAQIQPIALFLAQLSAQLDTRLATRQDYERLQAEAEAAKVEQKQQKCRLNKLVKQQEKKRHHRQQIALLEQEQRYQQSILGRTSSSLEQARAQLSNIEQVLKNATETRQQYTHLEALRQQEEEQSEQFQRYQRIQSERLRYQQQHNQQQQTRQIRLAQLEAQLHELTQQEKSLGKTLEKKADISHRLETLKAAKKQLRQFDATQARSAPLRQRCQQLQGQIAQAKTRLATRIEELDSRQAQIVTQQARAPQLAESATEISHRLAYLEQRKAYQEAVREKGVERRSFMARLRESQRNCEVELNKFDQMLALLEDPDTAHCPLCAQTLNGGTWQKLRDRLQEQREDVQNQIWATREQLAVSESEIQVLRQEYRVLEAELASYSSFLEEKGQLKEKLASVDTWQGQLEAMGTERLQLERCLQENDYAAEVQGELQQIEKQLAEISYDDRDHALVRSQVERLRWSELKYSEIKQAERRLRQIQSQRSQLETESQSIQAAVKAARHHPNAKALAELDHQLTVTRYSLTEHNQIRDKLKQSKQWEKHYQQLQQAQTQQSEVASKVSQLSADYKAQSAELEKITKKVTAFTQQLSRLPDVTSDIEALQLWLDRYRESRDRQLSTLGRLQQQLSQLDIVQVQHQEQQKKLADLQHSYLVYKSLSDAFGRNGIQALMIENLLPQLEATTNQILGRLSHYQLHVRFVTQRTGRNKKKLIDTLDILIADAKGTRPYETYSGGEAFRVNFAIRLAIARLLALRSGTALQMLIVDEGFGTQDSAGCERLIAAIEAIAPDFACILTITHMPHFREAFQTRIDVYKDNDGSHILISE